MVGESLADLAAARAKVFGTAYRSTFAVNDPCYREVATAEFGSLTTEIGTMMNTILTASTTPLALKREDQIDHDTSLATSTDNSHLVLARCPWW